MCFSAKVETDFKHYERHYRAAIDWQAFADLFERALTDDSVKIPRAIELNFRDAKAPLQRRVIEALQTRNEQLRADWLSRIPAQEARLAAAKAKLALKPTKTAQLDHDRAERQIKSLQRQLDGLDKPVSPQANRVFPSVYAPLIVADGRERIVRPMRYLIRRSGKPASDDGRYSGAYNARRDTIETSTFWSGQFGTTQGVWIVKSFFENVAKNDFEKRPLAAGERAQNLVLHFTPTPAVDMQVACLWSRWEPGAKDAADARPFESFAAITDLPPPEISAAGHDRCIVALQPNNLDVWLNPQGRSRAELFDVLADKMPLHYPHEIEKAA